MVSNFAVLLVVFEWYHGSERVKILFRFHFWLLPWCLRSDDNFVFQLGWIIIIIIIIIIKRISRAPFYHTRWQHMALYNNTNHTHTHTHPHARTHARTHTHSVGRGGGQGCAKKEKRKKSLEIIIKQVRLEGGFKRGSRIRVAEFLRQIVPDRWTSIRKRPFTKCFCVYE